jgi:hypothetical protein
MLTELLCVIPARVVAVAAVIELSASAYAREEPRFTAFLPARDVRRGWVIGRRSPVRARR